jgi:hypothetical protein
MLPARAPRLLYRAMGETPCAQISAKLHRGGIVVCTVPSLASDDARGLTEFFVSQGRLSRVRIMLSEESNPGLRDNTVCHEFMHATTGIRDNFDTLLDTSCVWGDLSAPGSFDAKFAHKVYKQKGDKSSGGKKHGGKKHGGGRGR